MEECKAYKARSTRTMPNLKLGISMPLYMQLKGLSYPRLSTWEKMNAFMILRNKTATEALRNKSHVGQGPEVWR